MSSSRGSKKAKVFPVPVRDLFIYSVYALNSDLLDNQLPSINKQTVYSLLNCKQLSDSLWNKFSFGLSSQLIQSNLFLNFFQCHCCNSFAILSVKLCHLSLFSAEVTVVSSSRLTPLISIRATSIIIVEFHDLLSLQYLESITLNEWFDALNKSSKHYF